MRSRWTLALALAFAIPAPGRAAAPGEPIVAARLEGSLTIDGRLDDPAWAKAPPFDAFVQVFPNDGAPPSERTTVRVLYDDRALYVGIDCADAEPGAMVRTLGRRDNSPYSDYLYVFVDPMRDRRAAYVFGLSASGVQDDGIWYDDDTVSTDWDAVWRGEVADTPTGWSAELEIPLSALRISDAPEQVWGFGVRRLLARSHEESATALVRRNERGLVPRLGTLVGLVDLHPVPELEVVPYAALRLVHRPELAGMAQPRVLDLVGDLGVDLKSSLGRALTLQASVNPDFGQVEADELIQNLTTYELYLPEKRPFFQQNMDVFQAVSPFDQASPQQLFYSRRIGLDAPILGAAKISGQVGDVQLGAIEAFVTGAARPDGNWPVFAASQPLHFAPARAYPPEAPASRNFVAAVARWRQSTTSTFGAIVTSALPAGDACTQADVDDALAVGTTPPPRCEALVGNAAALDWNLRSTDGAWFLRGQLTGSQYLGGRPRAVLEDGTVLRRGDLGYGAFASAGRQGGEPWRFDATWEYESPALELDAVGYQRTQNEQAGVGRLLFARPSGAGAFHRFELGLSGEARFTTDGRALVRGRKVSAWAQGVLRSWDTLGCQAALDLPYWDVREVAGTGVAYGRPVAWRTECSLSTDQARPVRIVATVGAGGTGAAGPYARHGGWDAKVDATLRPHPRFESLTEVRYVDVVQPARFVALSGAPAGTYYFADLRAPSLSVLLREQLVLSTRLTLQAYAQLFTSPYDYRALYSATPSPGAARIRPADLAPAVPPVGSAVPDRRDVALNVNVVLRWEYLPGSALFVVYTREQTEPAGIGFDASLAPHALGIGPTTDTFLVKWSYRSSD